LHEREKQPKVRRHLYFKRRHGAALAAMLVASVIVIFYLDTPAGKNIQKQVNEADKKLPERTSITQLPTEDQTESSLRPQIVSSIDTNGGIANPTPAKPDVHDSASTPNITVQSATKTTPATDREGIEAKTSPMAHSSVKWSVQVSAPPAKDIADTLVQRLKAKGYDGYVVQAEVKGQSYYRVRVGYFDSREKAESVRQSLTLREGYPDAYLTGD
jgi:cell division septation protein DedD